MLSTSLWRAGVAVFSAVVVGGPAFADDGVYIQHTDQPVVVDGVLDEAIWSQATPVTDFVRYTPTDGGPPPGQTEVRFVQDADTLYIGVRISGVDYPIQARVSPREDVNDDDQIGVYIDTVGDGRTGYIFYFNPIGIQQDIRYSNGQWMMEWNTIFTSKGTVQEDGFTLEVAIPFRSLQYPDDANNWHVMLTRKVPTLGAKYSFPRLRRGHPQLFVQAVPLHGVTPPDAGAGVWLQPTLSARHVMTIPEEGDSLQWTGPEPWMDTLRPSLDLRWGVTPDTALTFTVNPDFSQVEGDVRQVNLNQRFAFFYPEQRPFFLSNIDVFQDNAETLYTRSIVNPLTGMKLAGQEGAWDFGVLHGIDQSPNASVHEFGASGFSADDIGDQFASTTYLRLRRAAFQSGFVGVFAADKRIVSATPFDGSASSSGGFNDVVGMDVRSNIGTYSNVMASSSVSLLGENDGPSLGSQHALWLERTPDLGVGYSLSGLASTKEFRQEMGFLNQSGLGSGEASLSYTNEVGERSLLINSLTWVGTREWDDDQNWDVSYLQSWKLGGLHNLGWVAGLYAERYQDAEVMGPYVDMFWFARLSNAVSTRLFLGSGTVLDYSTLSSATDYTVNGVVRWRPLPNLRVDSDFNQQWYLRLDDTPQSIQRIYTRLNWQFSPYLGTRFIQQSVLSSDSDDPSFFVSALMSFITTPGNEVYVGGTWNMSGTTQNALQEQMLFAKWTHLFQY